jgi:hypothetical protein
LSDLVCTTTSLATTMLLMCSAPPQGFWHDAGPAILGFASAIVGAVLAFGGQWLATRGQKQIQNAEFARRDDGIRRQLKALMAHVSRYVILAKSNGAINFRHLDHVMNNLNEHIYVYDVSTALSDAQAAALYEAAEAIDIARRYIHENGLDLDSARSPEARDQVKAAFGAPRNKVANFWKEIGDASWRDRLAK